ncbi:hypothetical protein GH714_036585 [Hevea brasiliensis]|uniref:Uncharacterized protein n=1 Tax=Hevea brasiliensis TaxID=3981 RepID=A0A6A6NEV2_HEVBR|nr:hypothetical protein GH714_036585 [Hevea brasiliensis]
MGKVRTTHLQTPFKTHFASSISRRHPSLSSHFQCHIPVRNAEGFLKFRLKGEEGVNSVTQRRVEAPSTPGRPVFSYSIGNLAKKSFPSKWENAEKWLMSSSCHESPAHAFKPSAESSKVQKQSDNFKQQMEVFAEKSRVTEEKVSKIVSSFQGSVSLDQHNPGVAFNGVSASPDVLLKDKFTDEVESVLPNFRYSEPSKEGFFLETQLMK